LYIDGKKPYDGLCDVCRIFGATGWSRRFRIIVSEDSLQPKKAVASRVTDSGRVFNLSPKHPDIRMQGHKWYLNGDPLAGQVTLSIISTARVEITKQELFDPAIISALFQFIADRGSIGAKPQMGLGVVQVIERQNTQPLLDHLTKIIALHQKNGDLRTPIDDELPCLQNMFFARINVHSSSELATFDLKYDLRNMLREKFEGDNLLRHTIMGYVKRDLRGGAKIMMSYPDENGTIRMWGWIPRLPPSHPSRNEISDRIYYFLKNIDGADQIPFWYFDAEKDSSALEYLEEYLLIGVQNNA
jgi:CRISPR-associated protein Cmr1